MSRTIDAAIIATLDDAWLCPVLLVKLVFDDGTLYLHTDLGDISFDGHTWVGAGGVGEVEGMEERAGEVSGSLLLRLSGVDTTLLNEALIEDYYDRPVTIYLSVRDSTSGALVANPFELFSGRMDQMRVNRSNPTSMIELAVESELIEFEKAAMRFFSDSDLQKDYPGDLGFQYMAAMQNLKLHVGDKHTVNLGTDPGPANSTSKKKKKKR